MYIEDYELRAGAPFEDGDAGDTFVAGGDVYLKMDEVGPKINRKNAVSLIYGWPVYFEALESVVWMPFKAVVE